MTALAALAALALAAWVWLIGGRGGFWRADQRLGASPEPARWLPVAVVVPARNEAEVVGAAVASLLAQDYPAPFRIVLIDDASEDGTADRARAAAAATGPDAADRLAVLSGRPLAAGWTGKVWAMQQGVAAAGSLVPDAEYLLLTDADIAHDPASLRRLVAKATAEGLDLVSLMVRLHCAGFWERLLIPAFVFFFQKLYPFPWVNDPRRRTAAAAGGCMLVRAGALRRIGGPGAIRDRVIDDCALAAAVKRTGGPIWLGLADRGGPHSLRGYDGLGGIWRMVARTAYVQLNGSPPLLLVSVLGMALLYLLPPITTAGFVLGDPLAGGLGLAGWAAMAACYRPILSDYRLPGWAGAGLPLAALLYIGMTIDSARRTRAGRGAQWKGRSYAADTADSAEAE